MAAAVAAIALFTYPAGASAQEQGEEHLSAAQVRKMRKEAEKAKIKAALDADCFNVILTQNVPQRDETVVYYPAGEYIIRIRGDKAEVFMPGVTTAGQMEFGGRDVIGASEPVPMTIFKKTIRKKLHEYIFRSNYGYSWELTVRANENGSASLRIVRQPMGHYLGYYGEITPVEEQ